MLDNFDNEYLISSTLNGMVVDFTVYQILGIQEDGKVLMNKKDYVSSPDPVESPDDADVFLDGSIKWDGCSNWDFHTDACMAHFCSRDSAIKLGALMGRMYEIAEILIPSIVYESK